MRKYLVAVFFVILLAAIWIFQTPAPPVVLQQSLFLTISADGPAQPGQSQEISVNAFSRQADQLVRESGLQISADLIFSGAVSGASSGASSRFVCELKQTRDGSYRGSLTVPDSSTGSASLKIFLTRQPERILFHGNLPVEHDRRLLVLPPPVPVHAGNWLSFRIASINRKTGSGNFKMPVRVKMRTPGGHITINRVILTDIHGTAVFTTQIHDHAAPGVHEFEFTQGNTTQVMKVSVNPPVDKAAMVSKLIEQRSGLIPALSSDFLRNLTLASPPVHIIKIGNSEETLIASMLSEVKVETDQAFLTYNCAGSEFRQVEVWQNGKMLYNSDLQLESGRISIPFPHPPESSQPMFFRVWQIAGSSLKIQEMSVLPVNCKLTAAISLLKEADLYVSGGDNTSFATLFFTRPGFFAASPSIVRQQLTLAGSPELVQQHFESQYAPADTSRLFPVDNIPGRSLKRFFIVDSELNLSRFRFSTMRIWLDPSRFFTSVIAALRHQRANVDFLIGEAECRALRFGFLGFANQPAELEKMEGIMALLAELKDYADANPERAANWRPALVRVMNRLSKLIHTPDSFNSRARPLSDNEARLGPFSPILPNEVSLEKLFSALKPGGKVSLSGNGRTIPMPLTGEVVTFNCSSLPGQNNHIEKLVNARSQPLVVELNFAGIDEY